MTKTNILGSACRSTWSLFH